MISTSLVFVAARAVRRVALLCAVALVLGYVAISSFSSRYGTSSSIVLDSKSAETALSSAVSAQESAGLSCSDKPTLTNVVLFQREGRREVSVLTFDQAIKATSAHEGWIRRYCSAP
ncbi:hypothetical protein [Aeromicrobium ginsengisoli]|uniref:Uncharacterized protein n=1 Tax=Aeromicrobium ginsengisoli TaxID=363867 RepID=A0A5M4FGI5_9ACTN|nr:hypothetical protein [Aeromicrobium ginsengisoli]KAA1397893.1 hypothetical protein ESP70_011165 [Aeromicrobium ginsengisoli]